MSADESGTPPTEKVGTPLEPADVLETSDEGLLGSPWDRRTFLKAAALGTAAAALWQKGPGLTFGPAAAYANDLSNKPCTAGDVEIVGTPIILNAPCDCTTPGQLYNANVQFTVRNSTSTGRYCIGLHLVGGSNVADQDVVLKDANGSSTAPGKSGGNSFQDTVMFGTIVGVPCEAGDICFPPNGTVTGKCAPGTCTTISWNTSPGDAGCSAPDTTPPGGQCRHQGFCIRGYTATLSCSAPTPCTPQCGGTVTLRACAIADPARGPFDFTLKDGNGNVLQTKTGIAGDASGTTCVTFDVVLTQTTSFALEVDDTNDCTRHATFGPITITPVTVSLAVTGNTNCDGNLTFTATPSTTGCSFVWKVGGVVQQGQTANTFAYRQLDGVCTAVRVEVTCGSCSASAERKVRQCVTTTLDCT